MLGGILAATVLRVGFALVAVQALAIIGLTLAGGVLLLWVAWKLFRETAKAQGWATKSAAAQAPVRGLRGAMVQIALADVSMSLDNVLAVAGTARDHPVILATGLVLSVALMGLASTLVSRALDRLPWLAWIGLAIIVWSALSMIRAGLVEVGPHIMGALG
jgi:YjbE family integral membrane protein